MYDYTLLLFNYPTVWVTFKIAQNIAKANHKTKNQAIKIAIGSIHFVKLDNELSTSIEYWLLIFFETTHIEAVFSQTEKS